VRPGSGVGACDVSVDSFHQLIAAQGVAAVMPAPAQEAL
jgi:hypothetical protein